jgi:DNA-binding transcriptional ArsR family regulator/uncharacterized protein YndB with AHSA1/START domain
MDEVFRAVNDPSRRLLLDRLFAEDGQTLGELCRHLPGMTRYGVMNHLRVLEEAELITTHKVGRSKYHYLNPVPIRLIHDRWISKYATPVVGTVARIKAGIEHGRGARMSKPDHVYQAYIAAAPEEIWRSMTDGDYTVQYFYGTRVESDWSVGAPVRYLAPDGSVVADGAVLAADPPKRLEMSFHARWDPDLEQEGPVREVWLVEETDGQSRLRVELYDAPIGSRTLEDFSNGFPYIVSGLKTLLETGAPMAPPG